MRAIRAIMAGIILLVIAMPISILFALYLAGATVGDILPWGILASLFSLGLAFLGGFLLTRRDAVRDSSDKEQRTSEAQPSSVEPEFHVRLRRISQRTYPGDDGNVESQE